MPGEGARKGGSLEGDMALGGTVMVPTINIQKGEEVDRVTIIIIIGSHHLDHNDLTTLT